MNWDEAKRLRENLGESGKTVVFTNGCFDLVHPGHIHLLKEAREQGDFLFLGLNSDESIRRIKSPQRPILPEADRIVLLKAIRYVDGVVVFEEDTPMSLIKTLRPDVLVKGADYEKNEIVGADFVEGYGGRIHRVKLVEGRGTTEIIRSIQELDLDE